MVESILHSASPQRAYNSRTAGTMPVWGQPSTTKQAITQNLQSPEKSTSEINGHTYAATESTQKEESPFGFADLIDMVNPLQHIPLVNIAYQKVTGDEIKPISQIIGGGLFGGALGAGGALVNVAIQAETGKNISEHAISIASGEKNAPSNAYRTASNSTSENNEDHPEQNLNDALLARKQMDDNATIAYTDLGFEEYKRYETKPVANGRTAGHTTTEHFDITAHQDIVYREPITELKMSAMPAHKEF